jgi:hypothetical protein
MTDGGVRTRSVNFSCFASRLIPALEAHHYDAEAENISFMTNVLCDNSNAFCVGPVKTGDLLDRCG